MIILILLLGLVFRLINLSQSLWLDEAITAVTLKNLDFLDILTRFSPGDFHPPLFYLIEKLWTNIFGYSELALRLPSVFFGLGTIYLVWLLTKSLFSRKTAVLASLLVSINPLLVYYSQEARMYSLATFLVVGCVLFLLKKRWLIFTILLIASFYTDYLPWLMIPVYFFISSSKRKFLISLSVSLIIFLPWLPTFTHQLGTGISGGDSSWGDLLGRTNFKNLILIPLKFTTGRITIDEKYLYNLVFGGILLLILLILSKARSLVGWMWLTIPLVLAAIISLRVPLLTYFRFLFVLPGFIILLAEGVTNKKALAALLVSIFIGSSIVLQFFPRFQRENWREAANYASDGQIVMPNKAQSAGIAYYRPDLTVVDRDTFIVDGRSPIYLFRYVQEVFDPVDELRRKLELNNYHNVAQKNYNGVVVWKYVLN
jgi:uncharacterized membrane protein